MNSRIGISGPRYAAVALVLAVVAGACSGGGGGGKKVLLESSSASGPDAFSTSVHYTPVASTAPASAPPTSAAPGAGGHVSGSTPGLYGGTQNQAACDVEQMIGFLSANPDKAKAWAGVEGIGTDQIPDYLHSLTPVVLRVDTRVTNHGFSGGKATPRQSVLQAGTAVLVDKMGVPRAKCACGNPLLPPIPSTGATYSGTAWSGFSPGKVVIVNQATPVTQFTLVDVNTGQSFTRPVGGNGSTDTPASSQPTGTREQDRTYTGTGSKTIGEIDVDVPFVIVSPYYLTATGVSGYFGGSGGPTPKAVLSKAGHYPDVAIGQVPEGTSWTVVVRPLGPNLYHQTGTGSAAITLPNLPTDVVTDLEMPDGYLNANSGLVDGFGAVHTSDLAGLTVHANHPGAGDSWTLDIWGLPPGCTAGGEGSGTNSVKCS